MQEAEIRRILVQSQPRQIFHKTYLKKTHHKKRTGGVAQGLGSEFKSQPPSPKKEIEHIVTSSRCIIFTISFSSKLLTLKRTEANILFRQH
jgi:hypothetical protein